MTATDIALIISSLATLVTAVGGFIVLVRKVEVIHKATNSLATKLAESNLAQGTAEGKAIGLQQGREERRE